MDAQDVLNVVVIGSIYTLFALGLTLSWGVLNILNLAHGATFMFGGLLAYLVTKDSALSLWIVLPISALACGLIAVVLEVVAYRQIRNRVADLHAAELATMIASIGAAAALVAGAEVITENQLVGINPATFNVTRTEILGLRITNLEIIIIIAAALLSVLLVLFVTRTRHGRALRALAQDPYTCGLMGISPDRMAAATMFVSGALAGVAGVLLAMQLNTVEAHVGEPLLLKAFAVIILGGVGSVQGAIAAAFIVALAETLTDVYIGTSVRDAVAFGLIILLLLFRPQGLFSRVAWQRA
jgi:branched-chain amino acid transport system permease protein